MEIIPGTPGPDELFAGMEDTLEGGAGNDILDARAGEGDNLLLGQEGDDLLFAGSNDILEGGPGNDQLFGGTGGSTLTGGPGADGLWIIDGALPEEMLEVTDFVQGTDVLGILGFTLEEVIDLRVEQIDADTMVTLDGVEIAILRNTVARTLTRNDFAIVPIPEVSLSLEPDSISEGDSTTLTLSLSAPAPSGGLEVAWTELDSDGALGDIEPLLEESTNIVEFEGLVDGDVPIGAVVTIAPGATEATVVFSANEDELEEGPETTTYTLQPGDGYIVDPENSSDTLTITDEPIMELEIGLSVEPDSIAEGESTTITFSLSAPAPESGLEITWSEEDSDEALGDVELLLDESTNILDFEGFADGDVPTGARATIAPGATEATVVIEATPDSEEEGPETTTYTLQPGPGYIVDPENSSETLTITDEPIMELEIGISVEPDSIAEGESTTITLSLSEPAPESGLEVAWTEVDSDGALGDIEPLLEESTNIVEFEGLVDGDVPTGAIATIAPGATEATVVFSANEDETEEGPETTTYTLQPGSGYIVDPENSSDTLTITDEDDSRMSEILERGFLRVGAIGGVPGLSLQQEDGSFTGMGVDLSRAIAVALFDDPDAIEFVSQEFADSFGNTADGTVDISTVAVQNLTRDGSLEVDYSPIYLYDGVGFLVPADSGVTSVADMEGLTIGILEASTAEQALIDAAEDAGVEISLVSFPTLDDVFAAYDAGEVDAASNVRSVLASRIPTLNDPDNQSILDEVLSKDPIGLLVPENESELADVVRWVTYATFQAEEFGITSENVEDLEDSEDPAIARFLGEEGNLGEALGLEEDFVVDVIEEFGNYGEIYARNFDEDIIPRGLNDIWAEGGLIYSHPFSGMAMSDNEFDDNDDRNVLEEVKERGVVRVGINGDLPGFSQLVNDEFLGFDVDYGKAIAAAVFGDPEAVEFVVQERSDRFSDAANGIVDVTSHGATHNLVRDAVGGVDFAPVSLFDGQVVSAPIDSDIESLEDLEGLSLGVFAGTTSEQNIMEVLDALDITVDLVTFDSGIALNDAFQNGEIDAVTGDGSFIQGLALNVPPAERIPSRPIATGLSKEPLAMAVDENQSEWKDVVSWTVYATIQAAEFGITSENVDDFLDSDDAAIRRFLGVEGDNGVGLGLDNDFVVDVISSVGNWQEIYDRNFPFPDAPPIGGGLFTEGGQLYSPPFA